MAEHRRGTRARIGTATCGPRGDGSFPRKAASFLVDRQTDEPTTSTRRRQSRTALRRAAADTADEPVLRADGLELDQAAHRVTVDGADVHLTPTEFELLRSLMRNRGRLMTHRALLTDVWGAAYEHDTQVLRVHLANLRRKIEASPHSPRRIITDPGIGYRFADEQDRGS